MGRIIELISKLLALMLVLSIHEFAHSFAAVKSGDMTPKLYGRYTINPLAHFDLTGLLCFLFVGFGWAKPVPVNPSNFKRYKIGCFWVSIAGVLANYMLAFVMYPLFVLSATYIPQFGKFTEVLVYTLLFSYSMSLSFTVFNLLPLYPLDGFRVVDVFSKKRGKVYMFLRNYGTYILYGLVLLSILADFTGLYFLDFFGKGMQYAVSFISKPINMFWGLIF